MLGIELLFTIIFLSVTPDALRNLPISDEPFDQVEGRLWIPAPVSEYGAGFAGMTEQKNSIAHRVKSTQLWNSDLKIYQLLTTNAKDFDFRDENNQPIDGNEDQIQSLFLYSAFNLLVLGETRLKTIADSLYSQQIKNKLVLLAVQTKEKIMAIALSWSNPLRRLLSVSRSKIEKPSSMSTFTPRSPLSLIPKIFAGAPNPLRL